jgi:hypothetical protein
MAAANKQAEQTANYSTCNGENSGVRTYVHSEPRCDQNPDQQGRKHER